MDNYFRQIISSMSHIFYLINLELFPPSYPQVIRPQRDTDCETFSKLSKDISILYFDEPFTAKFPVYFSKEYFAFVRFVNYFHYSLLIRVLHNNLFCFQGRFILSHPIHGAG